MRAILILFAAAAWAGAAQAAPAADPYDCAEFAEESTAPVVLPKPAEPVQPPSS